MTPTDPAPRPLLYQSLADEIASRIDQGLLQPGEKLPSIRKLSAQRQVSLSTVMEAFGVLEDRGLVEARPQSGYYVRRRRALAEPRPTEPASQPRAVQVEELMEAVLQDGQVEHYSRLTLGGAMPDPGLFPVDRLRRVMTQVLRDQPDLIGTYGDSHGNLELRRQIARRALLWGGTLSTDELVVTHGCIEALNLCLHAVTQPGDVVAIESPAFFGLLRTLDILKLKALEIPTHPRDGVSLEALELATRNGQVKACVFSPNFANPFGSLMPDARKQQLVALLAERNIPLIEDDVFGEFFDGARRPPPAKFYDRNGMVMLCDSFTKLVAPDFRVGWVAAGRFQRDIVRLKKCNTQANPELLQLTLARYLAESGSERHLRNLRQSCARQRQQYLQAIDRYFPAETRVTRPQGGYVVWLEFPRGFDSLALLRDAASGDVGYSPGSIFSADPEAYRHCVRINCGRVFTPAIEAGLRRLGELAAGQLNTGLPPAPQIGDRLRSALLG